MLVLWRVFESAIEFPRQFTCTPKQKFSVEGQDLCQTIPVNPHIRKQSATLADRCDFAAAKVGPCQSLYIVAIHEQCSCTQVSKRGCTPNFSRGFL